MHESASKQGCLVIKISILGLKILMAEVACH